MTDIHLNKGLHESLTELLSKNVSFSMKVREREYDITVKGSATKSFKTVQLTPTVESILPPEEICAARKNEKNTEKSSSFNSLPETIVISDDELLDDKLIVKKIIQKSSKESTSERKYFAKFDENSSVQNRIAPKVHVTIKKLKSDQENSKSDDQLRSSKTMQENLEILKPVNGFKTSDDSDDDFGRVSVHKSIVIRSYPKVVSPAKLDTIIDSSDSDDTFGGVSMNPSIDLRKKTDTSKKRKETAANKTAHNNHTSKSSTTKLKRENHSMDGGSPQKIKKKLITIVD